MKTKFMGVLYLVVMVALSCVACGDDGVGDVEQVEADNAEGGKEDSRDRGTAYEFAFREEEPEAYTVKVDHLGVSLLATVLLNRSDSYSCTGVNNQTQLLAIYDGLVELHRAWGDDVRRAGFQTCSMGDGGVEPTEASILDFLEAVPCTTQKYTRVLPDGQVVGGLRVVDIITPDFVVVDVDEPGGFPNGRVPSDQVTDLILAMGMVDLTTTSPDQVQLNPPFNDVPFPDSFPWLAPAHTDIPE